MKKYQGKLVILDKPEVKKGSIELSEKDIALQEAELVKKWGRLKVHAVGEDVKFCKPGDEVLVTARQLSFLLSDLVVIDGKEKFVAQESHIIGVY